MDWWWWWCHDSGWATPFVRMLADPGRGHHGPVMAYRLAMEWVFIVCSITRSLPSRLDVVDWRR